LLFELEHLKAKLRERDNEQYEKIAAISNPLPNPIFFVRKGGKEAWEKVR